MFGDGIIYKFLNKIILFLSRQYVYETRLNKEYLKIKKISIFLLLLVKVNTDLSNIKKSCRMGLM